VRAVYKERCTCWSLAYIFTRMDGLVSKQMQGPNSDRHPTFGCMVIEGIGFTSA
jgi:hypothetical protein